MPDTGPSYQRAGAGGHCGRLCGVCGCNNADWGCEMKYYIARKCHFYGPRAGRYTLGQEPVAYDSRREALEEIKAEEGRTYYLSHNESGRPTLKAVSGGQLTKWMRLEIGG